MQTQIVALKTDRKTCACGCAIPVKGVVQMQIGVIIRCQFCTPVLVSMHAASLVKHVYATPAIVDYKPNIWLD